MQFCTREQLGNQKCLGYHNGQCLSIENCMWQSDGKLRNGMWNYNLVKPTENKPYLVMFHGTCDENVWFAVIHYEAKEQIWKRLNDYVSGWYWIVGWCELPSKEYKL